MIFSRIFFPKFWKEKIIHSIKFSLKNIFGVVKFLAKPFTFVLRNLALVFIRVVNFTIRIIYELLDYLKMKL
jgi:hypothetical protein